MSLATGFLCTCTLVLSVIDHSKIEAAARAESRVGATSEVLIERPGIGRTDFYAPVECPETLPLGAITRMRFTAASGRQLVGVPLS